MKLSTLLTASLVMIASQTSFAKVINNDGAWHSFSFSGVGSAWSDTFSLTLTQSAWLNVTDLYISGDQFEVFANEKSLGKTSVPTTQGDQIGGNFTSALQDARWSSGKFLLGAGNYRISGLTLRSPFGEGGAALQVAPVPEPETYALMGMGLVGLLAARRRKDKQA